jgi:putative membrane protein
MIGYGHNICGFIGNGLLGGGFLMMLIPLILIGVIIYIIYKTQGRRNITYENKSDNALEILNERFARGEINEEEYKQKKALLKH